MHRQVETRSLEQQRFRYDMTVLLAGILTLVGVSWATLGASNENQLPPGAPAFGAPGVVLPMVGPASPSAVVDRRLPPSPTGTPPGTPVVPPGPLGNMTATVVVSPPVEDAPRTVTSTNPASPPLVTVPPIIVVVDPSIGVPSVSVPEVPLP